MSLEVEYFSGLDIGCVNDPSALAVLEKRFEPDEDNESKLVSHYAVRHLERFQLGTAYPFVVDRVIKLFDKPPLADSRLAVDQTGVGRPVVDTLRFSKLQAVVSAITITAGHAANKDEWGDWLVPKKILVSILQVLLQGKRLKIASTLPEAAMLVKELENFKVKITLAANEVFGAWREGQHDDLVLAIACAAFDGEQHPPPTDAKPFIWRRYGQVVDKSNFGFTFPGF
jgi:hypothetical protein